MTDESMMNFDKSPSFIIRSNPYHEAATSVAFALADDRCLPASFKSAHDISLARSLNQELLAEYLLHASARATDNEISDGVIAVWAEGSQLLANEGDRAILVAAAQGKLLFVRADNSELPLGFRNVVSVSSPFDVEGLFRSLLELKQLNLEEAGPPAMDAAPSREERRAGSLSIAYRLIVATVISVGAALAIISTYSSNFPVFNETATESAIGIVVFVVLIISTWNYFRSWNYHRRQRRERSVNTRSAESESLPYFFISYARRDASRVQMLLRQFSDVGLNFWIDQHGITKAAGWASQIVEAMRDAAAAVVLCSRASFQSENVAREIYLADHLKKPIAPIFIEAVQPPDELLYFLVKPQQLRLYDIDASQVPARLATYLTSIGKA